jgi:hypothetical protein
MSSRRRKPAKDTKSDKIVKRVRIAQNQSKNSKSALPLTVSMQALSLG